MTAPPVEARCDVAVRWCDIDALGHVGHAVYLTYFEEQRDEWLRQRLGLCGQDYVVASARVDYESPILLEDGPVSVSSAVENVGRTSVTLSGVLQSCDGTVCARSRTSIVLWNAQTQRPRPITVDERARLCGGGVMSGGDGMPR